MLLPLSHATPRYAVPHTAFCRTTINNGMNQIPLNTLKGTFLFQNLCLNDKDAAPAPWKILAAKLRIYVRSIHIYIYFIHKGT